MGLFTNIYDVHVLFYVLKCWQFNLDSDVTKCSKTVYFCSKYSFLN